MDLQDNWYVGDIKIKNTSVFHGVTGDKTYLDDLGGNDLNSSEPTSGKKIFYIKTLTIPDVGALPSLTSTVTQRWLWTFHKS